MHMSNAPVCHVEWSPPQAVEAEASLIGALLVGAANDAAALAEVRSILTPDAFYQGDHAIYFETICALADAAGKVDGVLVREELKRRQLFEEVGGGAYLARLLNSVPTAAHAGEYAKRVRETYLLRRAIEESNRLLRLAYGASKEDRSADLLLEAAARLADLAAVGRGADVRALGDVLGEVREQMAQGGGQLVPTGFVDLDHRTGGGLGPGEMVIVGGRPSMGKSLVAKQIALQAARAGIPAGVISNEEKRTKISRNLLSSESQVENKVLRRGKLDEMQWREVDAAIGRLSGLPLYLCERATRMSDIRAAATAMVARHGVRLLVIDYLQRIRAGGKDRYEQASNASLEVSEMLKDLSVPGLVVAQLNRGVESREDKRPTMADLRDSGQLEQDADGIIFVHREDYYHLDEPTYQPNREVELIIAKWRDGEKGGVVKLQSALKYQQFKEPDPFSDDDA